MLNIKTLSALVALTLASAAAANAPQRTLTPVFVEGSQYSAVLEQDAQRWRLLSDDGADLTIAVSGDCTAGTSLPEGIWMLTRGVDGKPTLTAPSATVLPDGYPEEVALLACDEADTDTPHLTAPRELIDWLSYNSGAIYLGN